MFCDNSAINEMNPGMAGFLVAKKRMVELNGGMQQGIVYLLGAGPGDPGLITVRGRELVGMAEVLVYDALSSAEMLNWAPAACERIFVGKRASRHALPQEEINASFTGEEQVHSKQRRMIITQAFLSMIHRM